MLEDAETAYGFTRSKLVFFLWEAMILGDVSCTRSCLPTENLWILNVSSTVSWQFSASSTQCHHVPYRFTLMQRSWNRPCERIFIVVVNPGRVDQPPRCRYARNVRCSEMRTGGSLIEMMLQDHCRCATDILRENRRYLMGRSPPITKLRVVPPDLLWSITVNHSLPMIKHY